MQDCSLFFPSFRWRQIEMNIGHFQQAATCTPSNKKLGCEIWRPNVVFEVFEKYTYLDIRINFCEQLLEFSVQPVSTLLFCGNITCSLCHTNLPHRNKTTPCKLKKTIARRNRTDKLTQKHRSLVPFARSLVVQSKVKKKTGQGWKNLEQKLINNELLLNRKDTDAEHVFVFFYKENW